MTGAVSIRGQLGITIEAKSRMLYQEAYTEMNGRDMRQRQGAKDSYSLGHTRDLPDLADAPGVRNVRLGNIDTSELLRVFH